MTKHRHYVHHRKKHLSTYFKNQFYNDFGFSLLISLGSLGAITLTYISSGLYLHLNNILTLFAFIFVAQFLVKKTHKVGTNQAFYSAALGAFGYFLFYRIYFYITTGDFMKTNIIVGDSLINAVINVVIIYVVYNLFLYCKKH